MGAGEMLHSGGLGGGPASDAGGGVGLWQDWRVNTEIQILSSLRIPDYFLPSCQARESLRAAAHVFSNPTS